MEEQPRPPAQPDEQRQRLLNQRTVRDYVCAQCWGALVERREAEGWQVRCPRGCRPGGFVTRYYADQARAAARAEAEEVARNYPELAPEHLKPPAPEARRRLRRALWGEDEEQED